MRWLDVVALAKRSIKANKLRARITIAIIALGITALVGIITAINGLENSIKVNFSRMGSNTFNITSNGFANKKGKHLGGRKRVKNTEESKKISFEQANLFKKNFNLPVNISINTILTQQGVIKNFREKTNPNTWVIASDNNYLSVSGNAIAFGRDFNESDITLGRDFCLLGTSLATTLFGKYYKKAVGSSISIDNKTFFVIGVIKSKGASMLDRTDNMALVNINSARRQFSNINKSYIVSIKVNQVTSLDVIAGESEGVMRNIRKVPINNLSDFDINKNDSLASSFLDNIKYVKLAAIIIGLITLLGAVIGLMNIMLVAVVERTKEIGLSKAIGAPSIVIQHQFLSESILISLYGGAWGTSIGILIGYMVAQAVSSPFTIPWEWIGISFFVCILVGVISGIYPAIKASKLNPINALRYE